MKAEISCGANTVRVERIQRGWYVSVDKKSGGSRSIAWLTDAQLNALDLAIHQVIRKSGVKK